MSNIKPLARRKDIVVQEFGNEILIYDLKAEKVFNLNETSMLIWQLSDGDKTLHDIAESASAKLNSLVSEEFVWLALEQLRKENLIENKTEIETLYQGVSRREIIKRVGLASLVALPIVSSLVAPVAMNAASTSCSQTNNSCSGTNRSQGCICSPGAGAGRISCNDNPSFPNCSNCAAGLLCYSGVPASTPSGFGSACCP